MSVRLPFRPLMLILTLALLGVGVLCLCIGSVALPLRETLGALLSPVAPNAIAHAAQSRTIVLSLRLPRVLLAMLCGAALSCAGCAMQGLTQNSLADGATLGVSAGGSLGAVLAMALGFTLPVLPQLSTALAGIVFAFISLLLVLAFARSVDSTFSSNTILLAGIIFSMLASSLNSLILAFSGDALKRIVFWSMGSFSGNGMPSALLMALLLAVGLALIFPRARDLDAFAQGEDVAAYAGVNLRASRLSLLAGVAVLCGGAVALCGNIAFVGLAIPHIMRLLIGPRHSRLLPACALGGAVFLPLCDLVARSIMPPVELPIGVLTSLVGTVVFIFVLYQQRREVLS